MATTTGGSRGFFGDFFDALKDEFGSVIASLGNFFNGIGAIQQGLDDVKAKAQALGDNIRQGVQEVTDFHFDPAWKNRVINVPTMIDQVRDFIQKIPNDIRDKLQTVGADLEQIVQDAKDAQAVAAAYAGKPSGGAKLGAWIGAIQRGFQTIVKFIEDLNVIVNDLKEIVHQLETLDALFLQQKNPRKTVDGFRLRVGKLHDSL